MILLRSREFYRALQVREYFSDLEDLWCFGGGQVQSSSPRSKVHPKYHVIARRVMAYAAAGLAEALQTRTKYVQARCTNLNTYRRGIPIRSAVSGVRVCECASDELSSFQLLPSRGKPSRHIQAHAAYSTKSTSMERAWREQGYNRCFARRGFGEAAPGTAIGTSIAPATFHPPKRRRLGSSRAAPPPPPLFPQASLLVREITRPTLFSKLTVRADASHFRRLLSHTLPNNGPVRRSTQRHANAISGGSDDADGYKPPFE